jgi:ornithine cyclodeaminase
VTLAEDLETAVRGADIVTCATMSATPVLRGEWLRPGTHVDLIGAYTPAMREADDEVMRRGRIFCDNRETVMNHIGELMDPLRDGVIAAGDVVADFYDLSSLQRHDDAEITVFKNGGGAHLDLMVSRWILERWQGR